MPSGLLYGLGAALAWGFTDIAAALSTRRLGSLRVLAGAQLVALIVLLALAVVQGVDPFAIPVPTLLFALGLGCLSAIAYLAFFTALRIGPIAVVSPVVSAYGGFTVALAVLFRGESLTGGQAVGALVASVGIVLTGIVLDGGLWGIRPRGGGVAFGLVAMALFAILTVATAGPIGEVGWLPVMTISRTSNTAVAWLLLVAVLVLRPPIAAPLLQADGPDAEWRRGLGVVVAAGLLDVLGLVSFAIGLEVAETWLVGLTSSFGPVVAVLVAVAAMGERLRPIQWLGLALLASGLVAIALA
jgi:drug/metabolite transporter (DMT)-like permease